MQWSFLTDMTMKSLYKELIYYRTDQTIHAYAKISGNKR